MELSDLRRDFGKHKLIESELPDSPNSMFRLWLEEVQTAGVDEFNAMVVSTVGRLGKPELFEFWQGGKHRLHDRIRYRLIESKWKMDRLAP